MKGALKVLCLMMGLMLSFSSCSIVKSEEDVKGKRWSLQLEIRERDFVELLKDKSLVKHIQFVRPIDAVDAQADRVFQLTMRFLTSGEMIYCRSELGEYFSYNIVVVN
jgi:hypothetical protein